LKLYKLSRATTNADDARHRWNAFRRSPEGNVLAAELARMAHTRNRCAYCDDSRGADVDHFAPINYDHTRTFLWDNHLWSCPECNRRKSMRFPVVGDQEMLLNPVIEDWWDLLTLDTSSGVVAPRFEASGVENRRGRNTLDIFKALTVEAVIEGRHRAIVALSDSAIKAVSEGDTRSTRKAVGSAVRQDDFGVAAWFALGPGVHEPPFSDLRTAYPGLWRRFVRATIAHQYGIHQAPLPG
jgi:uncharacterized protein (TIGR02646 family)